MDKINAFILAAGYGERLRPITNHIPKPLLPILGRPIIETVTERLNALPIDFICINMHHRWQQIRDWAVNSAHAGKIRLFHEKKGLGTGGAFKNAEASLKDSVFIAHNADIISDIDLNLLLKKHLSSDNIATLAIHDYEKFNNLWLDGNGHLQHVENKDKLSGLCKMAFMGIAVYSPQILRFLPEGESSVVDAWLKAVSEGWIVGTADFTGASWTDIGTPDTYADAVFDALKKNGEIIYLNGSVDCSSLELGADVVLEQGVSIEGSAYLRKCIALNGARIPRDSAIENSIEGPGFSVPIMKKNISDRWITGLSVVAEFSQQSEPEIACIGTGGSDRVYYRIKSADRSAVLMKCSEADQDYQRHMELTKFLKKYNLPVPDMLISDYNKKEALFEDLGDITLYSWLKCRRKPEQVEEVYRKTLDILAGLHTTATSHAAECPVISERIFDYSHLRWETDYFLEQFIRGIKQAALQDVSDIKADFERLAKTADTFIKTIVHRDFQSQNIMIVRGIPRLIDFQGIRIGPPAYDLVSMLWDPYFRLEDDLRQRLIEHYIERRKTAESAFDETEFRQSMLPCRLQRHMQALGAYGFLSMVKGKKYFLKHVPQALEYLKEETALTRQQYPALHELISGVS